MTSAPDPAEVRAREVLKACPFCGGEASYVEGYWAEGCWRGDYVRCGSCPAQVGQRQAVGDANSRDRWNTRATEAPPVAGMGEELRALIERLSSLLAMATPGPWHADPADMFGDHNILRGNSDESLAIAAVVSNLRPAAEVAANANLIVEAINALPRLLAALTKPTPPASVSGEVLVPREPTEAMISACLTAIGNGCDINADEAIIAFKAMLAAAPEAATPSAVGGVDRLEAAKRAIALVETPDAPASTTAPWDWLYWDRKSRERFDRLARAALASGETSPERGDR